MLGKIIAGAAFVFAGSSTVLAGSACDYTADKICVETSSPGVSLKCDDGTVVEKCKAEDRFASCYIKVQSAEVYARFYTGYASDAEADCKEAKGTYTAD